MRKGAIIEIFRKEVLELIRDIRTLVVMFILPLLLYPILGLLTVKAEFSQLSKLAKEKQILGITGPREWIPIFQKVQGNKNWVWIYLGKDWKKRLKLKEIPLVIAVKGDPKEVLSTEKKRVELKIYYNSTDDRYSYLTDELRDFIERLDRWILVRRGKKKNLPPEFFDTVQLELTDVATPEKRGRFLLAKLLPLLLVLMTMTGAFYPAIDMTAGERERGTLETLLTSPARPSEIIIGKYLAVALISSLTGLLNIISLYLTFSQGLKLVGEKSSVAVNLGIPETLGILAVLLSVSLFASAAMLSLASLARSYKEAQNYITPVYLLAFIPIFSATLPGKEASFRDGFIPLLNAAYALKMLLEGSLNGKFMLATVLSSAVLAALFLKLSASIFSNETLLFRDENTSLRELLAPSKGQTRRKYLTLGELIFLLAVQAILFFYIGIPLQGQNIFWGLMVTLWLIIGGTAAAFAYWRGVDLRTAFSLTPPRDNRLRIFLGVVAVIAGALPLTLAATSLLSKYLFPNWEEYARHLQQMLSPDNLKLSWPALVFMLVISPAMCEEFLFRGLVLNTLLKRMKPAGAIAVSAALFASAHLSLYRFLPVFALGLILGWLAYRTRSLWPSIFGHGLNNLAVLLFGQLPENFRNAALGIDLLLPVLLIATASLLGGLFLISKSTEEKTPPNSPHTSAENQTSENQTPHHSPHTPAENQTSENKTPSNSPRPSPKDEACEE